MYRFLIVFVMYNFNFLLGADILGEASATALRQPKLPREHRRMKIKIRGMTATKTRRERRHQGPDGTCSTKAGIDIGPAVALLGVVEMVPGATAAVT